ncbi:glycoside hydrolase family 16 protein [Actinomadura parmotrematis]|uniref:Glycoside hydrolase family 16 protein n=1 Tax=Actinomadura parmotrematis TaxID=2864039 RepID=A0ABS7G016_9ACTN|nr:glycoside hydrolase family 16 protein [Actinomadura parmotrematis]MBW8486043.1 glycoside hydrolase family 16 protein [Actinomadura parmotrematis]
MLLSGVARLSGLVACLLAVGTATAECAEPPRDGGPPAPSSSPSPSGSAAARYGWGEPVEADEFTGRALDRAAWEVYDSPGHAGQGRRSPAAVTVQDGHLRITGRTDGTTGGLAWKKGAQRRGRWEARIRVSAGCACYHPVLLLWPVKGGGGVSPHGGGGEVDYSETVDDGRRAETHFFLHAGPEDDERQEQARASVDLTRWHDFAVEWRPRELTGYLDGRRWFHTADRAMLPPRTMGQTIQLDWFPGERGRTARGLDAGAAVTFDTDWIRMYRP